MFHETFLIMYTPSEYGHGQFTRVDPKWFPIERRDGTYELRKFNPSYRNDQDTYRFPLELFRVSETPKYWKVIRDYQRVCSGVESVLDVINWKTNSFLTITRSSPKDLHHDSARLRPFLDQRVIKSPQTYYKMILSELRLAYDFFARRDYDKVRQHNTAALMVQYSREYDEWWFSNIYRQTIVAVFEQCCERFCRGKIVDVTDFVDFVMDGLEIKHGTTGRFLPPELLFRELPLNFFESTVRDSAMKR